jgi:hypothetical protein
MDLDRRLRTFEPEKNLHPSSPLNNLTQKHKNRYASSKPSVPALTGETKVIIGDSVIVPSH